jgi:hypothetical protein
MLRLLPVLLIGCAAFAHAETYKWVDERGVTNYSNNPPPAAKSAKAVQQVEERISYYEPDPGLKAAAARPLRPSFSEAEWLQRQQIMAMRTAYPDCSWPYSTAGCGNGQYSDAYYPAYPIVVGARRPFFTSGRHANAVRIHSSTGGRRGALLR